MKKILAILLFSFFVSLPVILPFFHIGFFPTHDGEWAVVRLTDMFRALRDFQFPVRYSGELNFGYGYPLFNFAYPFPYYLGVLIYLAGAGFVDAIKTIFAGSVFLSAFFMFLASKALWKNSWAGIISTVIYIYLPYRMVDLYVRGSIGESLSFVLFPLLIYLAVKLIKNPSALLVGGIAFSLAILVTTHNIMTVLFMPVFIVFAMVQVILENKKVIKPFVLSLALGLGISAFFWIPALLEKSHILLSKIPIADRDLYFVTFNQLLLPRWGHGVPIDSDGFSYQLGLAQWIIIFAVALFLLFAFVKGRHLFREKAVKLAIALIALILFFIFLLFKPSELIWSNTPLLSEINYPWTALAILGFLVSLLAGFLSKQLIGKYIVLVASIIAVLTVFPYAKPEYYVDKGDNYYLTNGATTTSSNELMPLWVKKMPLQRPANKVELISGQGKIENIFYNSKQVEFSINALTQSRVRINTIYFPGWKVKVDSDDVKISYTNDQGVMDVHVSRGNHVVKADFEETPLRLFSNTISLLAIIVIILLIILKNRLKFGR
ncbi:MAG: hypothetical protein Q8P26_04925 [Candidatus Levybacteria bacterium]|nr:hypothetical protein [Candidatus Levybacteria bacterium]